MLLRGGKRSLVRAEYATDHGARERKKYSGGQPSAWPISDIRPEANWRVA